MAKKRVIITAIVIIITVVAVLAFNYFCKQSSLIGTWEKVGLETWDGEFVPVDESQGSVRMVFRADGSGEITTIEGQINNFTWSTEIIHNRPVLTIDDELTFFITYYYYVVSEDRLTLDLSVAIDSGPENLLVSVFERVD